VTSRLAEGCHYVLPSPYCYFQTSEFRTCQFILVRHVGEWFKAAWGHFLSAEWLGGDWTYTPLLSPSHATVPHISNQRMEINGVLMICFVWRCHLVLHIQSAMESQWAVDGVGVSLLLRSSYTRSLVASRTVELYGWWFCRDILTAVSTRRHGLERFC